MYKGAYVSDVAFEKSEGNAHHSGAKVVEILGFYFHFELLVLDTPWN